MLALESFSEDLVAKTSGDQIFVWRTLAGQNGPARIDERKYHGRVETFVFSLHMVDHAIMFYVRVESGYHNVTIGILSRWSLKNIAHTVRVSER
jgi:hypothetical protein